MTDESGRVGCAETGSRADASSPAVSTKGFDPARVCVTAADFNGYDWDGSPFDHLPKWLEKALEQGIVSVAPDDRDYAVWAVNTVTGVVRAEPGDTIVNLGGFLGVEAAQ